MVNRLAVFAGALALLVFGIGLPSAQAQATQYGDGEVSATGYLSPVSPPGSYSHLLNDEATGQQYLVRSGALDLGAYDNGQRITISGTLVSEGAETILEVTSLEEPQEPGQPGEAATLSFELLVKGEPPAEATFFGNIQTGEGGPGIFVPLADPDGDGVYTGATTIDDRFPPGLRPLPPDAEPLAFPIRIVQGTGTNPAAATEAPGEPISTLKDFGTVPLEQENTFSASFAFEGDENDPAAGEDLNKDGSVDEVDGELAARTSDAAADSDPEGRELPNTGGAVLSLLAAALLVGAGLLVNRTLR